MGSIDIIGSQLDVASIVSQLMELERLPVYRMEDQITSMQKKVSAYQTLNTRLSALANSVNMMLYGSTSAPFLKPANLSQRMESSIFSGRTAASSNENVLTASAFGATVSTGSYSLTVSQLAKAQTTVSRGFANINEDIGNINGTITFGIGDKAKTLDINLEKQAKIAGSELFSNPSAGIGTTGKIELKWNDGSSDHSAQILVNAAMSWEDLAAEIETVTGGALKVTIAEVLDEDSLITGNRMEITSMVPGSAGAFTITVNDDEDAPSLNEQLGFTQIQAARDTTLRDLQQAINEAAAKEGIGINASIINAGSLDGGEGGYRLMITSKETGTANSFEFGGDLDDRVRRFGFSNSQDAMDAKLTINGIDVTSSSNSVKDAIEGVTINLKNVTKENESVRIDIGVDNDAIVSAVKEMISIYNAVSSYINSQFNYTATSSTNSLGMSQTSVTSGVLAGDSTLRSIQSSLQSIISGGIMSGESFAYRSIGQVGINYERDGSLSLDEAKLREALAKDFDAVAGFFLGYDKTVDDGQSGEKIIRVGGMLTNMGESLKGLTDPLRNPIKNALSGLDNTIRNLQQSIEAYELRLQVREDMLYAQFSAADEALRLMRVTLANISGSLASLTNNNN